MDEPPSQPLLLFFTDSNLNVAFSLACIVVLLFLSALIAVSEVAFFSLKPQDLERYRKNPGEKEKDIVELLSDPNRLLAVILITHNLVKLSVITIVAFLLRDMGWTDNAPFTIIVISLTIFTLTFLIEIVPKSYALKHNKDLVPRMAGTWRTLTTIFYPISYTLLAIADLVQNAWNQKRYQAADELTQTLELVSENENATEDEKEILRGIVNFGTLTVKQVMQARIDIFAADTSLNFHELMDYINKSGFSRVPVYRQTIDNIEGVLYIKDLLPFIDEDEHFDWRILLRPGFFVPETKKLDFLLKDFQEKHVHMALVVDEYGGLSGLITLEDIIEEIIGDINDEFDEVGIHYKKINDQTFVFEGKISLNDFCKTLDIEGNTFDKIKGESESLGGLMLEINNELPSVGKKINYEQFTFVIEAADRRKIKKIRVHIHEQKES